jgi:DNA-binding transcriptional regulator YiaG
VSRLAILRGHSTCRVARFPVSLPDLKIARRDPKAMISTRARGRSAARLLHSGVVGLGDGKIEPFLQAFCGRVRAAREACGMTQAEMARRLEVSRSAYQRYETRTPLPHHLIDEFAEITGVDIKDLLSGSEIIG